MISVQVVRVAVAKVQVPQEGRLLLLWVQALSYYRAAVQVEQPELKVTSVQAEALLMAVHVAVLGQQQDTKISLDQQVNLVLV
jgi:hypothetical protein